MNSLFSDLVFWLKIFSFIVLIVAQFCAYKIAEFYFKNTIIAWIFSIAYSFSTFFFSQINNGHISFITAAAIAPGVFLLFEKLFIDPNRKSMVLATAGLIAVYFCDLQITIFTVFYLLLRVSYYLLTSHHNEKIIKRLFELTVLFSLSVAPFLLSFTLIQNTTVLSVPTIPQQYLTSPSQLFLNEYLGSEASGFHVSSLYVGVFIFALSILPILFVKSIKNFQRDYAFHLVAFVFFFLIATGSLSFLVTQLFVRVPSRAQIMVIFSLCVCAGYGLLSLSRVMSPKMQNFSWTRKKSLHVVLGVGLAVMIFMDLSASTAPITSDLPQLTGGDQFLVKQQGDFRVLKYPLHWSYSNYEASLLKHEIIGVSVIALRSYPTASQLFSQLGHTFNALASDTPEDPGNFTLLSTICGVKYVLINTTDTDASRFVNYFNNASGYFTEAYKDEHSVVYENLHYRGTVFAVKDPGHIPVLENLTLADFSEMVIDEASFNLTQGFNRIEIAGNLHQSAYIVLSQSYSPFWVKASDGSTAFVQFLNVTAFHTENGAFKVNAFFSAATQTSNLHIVFFAALVLSCLALFAGFKGKKNWLRFTLSFSSVFGLVTVVLALMGTNVAPQSLRSLGVFSGVFNTVILLFGVGTAVFSVVCLLWGKILGVFKFFLDTKRQIAGRLKKMAPTRQRALVCCALLGSLVLIVLAFYFSASQSEVFVLQQKVLDGEWTESYVITGTQFSINSVSTALLLIALSLFLVVGLSIGQRCYCELRKGMLTTKLVELLGLCALSVIVLYAFFNGGLFSAAVLMNNQLVFFMSLVFSLVGVATLLVIHPFILTSVSEIQNKLVSAGKVTSLVMNTLLIVTLILMVVANIPFMFEEGKIWLNESIVGILLSVLLLFGVTQMSVLASEKTVGLIKTDFPEAVDDSKSGKGLTRLYLGVFGGIVGICIAGLLMRTLTIFTQGYVGSALILCGALGGLGFGALTGGDRKLRGIIGCCFGVIAVFFGLAMAYNAPVIIGYMNDGTPLYLWHDASFLQFAETHLLSMYGLFYSFFGLLAAYLAGAYLSLRNKTKEIPS